MPKPKHPTALVFCVADHPVFEALLTVCRDVAASGRGLRSADDYRRWWFIVTSAADGDELELPPDAPGLDEEEFIPGFTEGAIDLLMLLDGLAEVAPIVGNKRPYWIRSHARLTHEPLEDYLRDRGFDVLRPHDVLARERNRPRGALNDVFGYEEAITDAIEDRFISDDDRVAFDYVLGKIEELPPTLAPSAEFFETVPKLPHPSEWIAQDHRVFDVLCRAQAFERISFYSYEASWADTIHARARELHRRNASPLEAFRGVLGRDRSLPENLELVAASARLRSAWAGDPSELEREIDRAKRSLVEELPGLVFDGLEDEAEVEDGDVEVDGEDADDEDADDDGEVEEVEEAEQLEEAEETLATPWRPSNELRLRNVFQSSYFLRSAWAHDDLLIAVGDDNLALRSIDAGETWTAGELPVQDPEAIVGRQLDDGRVLILVAGRADVAFSWDCGETWISRHTDERFRAVALAPDGRVCAICRTAWAVADDPAELHVHQEALGLEDVTFDDGRFYAVSIDGSVLTHERGNWQRLATSMAAVPRALAVRDDLMLVLAGEGVATSEDGGQSWTWTALERLGWPRAAAIARDGTRYIVAGQVLASEDGQRWRVVPVGDNLEACDIAFCDRAMVITSTHSITLVGPESSTLLGFGMNEFAECPEHYEVTEHGFASASVPAADQVTALFVDGDRFVLGIDDGLLVSEDGGRSWVEAEAPLRGRKVTSIVQHGGDLWAACEGVLRSSDGGLRWVTVEAPLITKLLATIDGELFAVRGEWLLRHDPEANSGWHACRRFDENIELLVDDESGAIYLVADELYISHDRGQSWSPRLTDERIVGVVPTHHGLLACDRESLHVSRDHGRSFESHRLPLHVDAHWRGQVHSFCGSASGDLYFSSDHFVLHSADLGRTLARVRTPFLQHDWVHRVVELGERQYVLIDPNGLLERVDESKVPQPRFIDIG